VRVREKDTTVLAVWFGPLKVSGCDRNERHSRSKQAVGFGLLKLSGGFIPLNVFDQKSIQGIADLTLLLSSLLVLKVGLHQERNTRYSSSANTDVAQPDSE
jgi:hypothetical protein